MCIHKNMFQIANFLYTLMTISCCKIYIFFCPINKYKNYYTKIKQMKYSIVILQKSNKLLHVICFYVWHVRQSHSANLSPGQWNVEYDLQLLQIIIKLSHVEQEYICVMGLTNFVGISTFVSFISKIIIILLNH